MQRILILLLLIVCAWSGFSQDEELEGTLVKWPFPVNTAQYDEFNPVIKKGDGKIYFTRQGSPDYRKIFLYNYELIDTSLLVFPLLLGQIYSDLGDTSGRIEHSRLNQDVFVFLQETPDTLLHPGYPLNSALPNNVISIDEKNDQLYLLNQVWESGATLPGFSKLPVKYKLNSTIHPIQILDFNTSGQAISADFSEDGTFLVISYVRQGRTNADIFISFRIKENVYSSPYSLGPDINTSYNETTPFITSDHRYIYFASDRKGGMGGLDVYYAKRLDHTWQKWGEIKKLPAPVNSAANESYPILDPATDYIHFTSDRDGTKDLFYFDHTPPRVFQDTLIVDGEVRDVKDSSLLRAVVRHGALEVPSLPGYYSTHTGKFRLYITKGHKLQLHAKKLGYKPSSEVLNPWALADSGIQRVPVILYLQRDTASEYIRKKEWHLDQIMFEKSKDVILAQSYKTLDTLYRRMVNEPDLKISLEGHTDNVGRPVDLYDLSRRRAAAVKVYLVTRGVEPERVITAGYGPDRPIESNDTEEGRAANRRVETYILEIP